MKFTKLAISALALSSTQAWATQNVDLEIVARKAVIGAAAQCDFYRYSRTSADIGDFNQPLFDGCAGPALNLPSSLVDNFRSQLRSSYSRDARRGIRIRRYELVRNIDALGCAYEQPNLQFIPYSKECLQRAVLLSVSQ